MLQVILFLKTRYKQERPV